MKRNRSITIGMFAAIWFVFAMLGYEKYYYLTTLNLVDIPNSGQLCALVFFPLGSATLNGLICGFSNKIPWWALFLFGCLQIPMYFYFIASYVMSS